jgi:hypothetical protein
MGLTLGFLTKGVIPGTARSLQDLKGPLIHFRI